MAVSVWSSLLLVVLIANLRVSRSSLRCSSVKCKKEQSITHSQVSYKYKDDKTEQFYNMRKLWCPVVRFCLSLPVKNTTGWQ